MTSPAYNQDAFQGRDDDVALNSATFNGGGGLNGNWSQDVDTVFRVRFVIQETNNKGSVNDPLDLYFSLNGSAYASVTTTTPVQLTDDSQGIADNSATTQVLGNGTYSTGVVNGYDDGTVDVGTGRVDFNGNDETEVEFCLTLDSAQISNGDEISLRVFLLDGTALDVYTNTPTITAVAVIAPTTVNANIGVVSVTGQAATVTPGIVSISAATGLVSVTGQVATVSVGTSITGSVGVITVAGQAATVSAGGGGSGSLDWQVYAGATPDWISLGANTLVFSGSLSGLTVEVPSGEFQDGTHIGSGDPGTDQCGANHANNVKYISDTEMQVNGGGTENINDTNLAETECTLRIHFSHASAVEVVSARLYVWDGSVAGDYLPGIEVYGFERGVGASQWTLINDGSASLGGDNPGSRLALSAKSAALDHFWYVALSVGPELVDQFVNLDLGLILSYR